MDSNGMIVTLNCLVAVDGELEESVTVTLGV
jgi:hypothetical protein